MTKPTHTPMRESELLKLLTRVDLRPTRQRMAVATAMFAKGHRHFTADMLHEEADAAGEKVSLATIYNTLRAFMDVGLLSEITVDPTRVYYDTRVDDHPHFYDEGTGELYDAPAESVAFAKLPTPPDGMQISKVDVVVRLRAK